MREGIRRCRVLGRAREQLAPARAVLPAKIQVVGDRQRPQSPETPTMTVDEFNAAWTARAR